MWRFLPGEIFSRRLVYKTVVYKMVGTDVRLVSKAFSLYCAKICDLANRCIADATTRRAISAWHFCQAQLLVPADLRLLCAGAASS